MMAHAADPQTGFSVIGMVYALGCVSAPWPMCAPQPAQFSESG
jgi:hypothetical protein